MNLRQTGTLTEDGLCVRGVVPMERATLAGVPVTPQSLPATSPLFHCLVACNALVSSASLANATSKY